MTHPTIPPADSREVPTQPETRGIEFIPPSDRRGRARDLFAVWAAPNVSILNLTIGATLIMLGLELWQAICAVLVAACLWALPGTIAAAGPVAGTSGSVITRAIYGIRGNKIFVVVVGWFIGSVFLSLTWLASSFMGAELLTTWGVSDPVWVPIVVTLGVSVVTILVAVFGHGLILRAYPYLAAALFVIFVIVTVFIFGAVDWNYRAPQQLEGVALWSALTIGFTLLASNPLSFINSPDIARYLPRSIPPWRIAVATACGGAVPFIAFTTVGALFATTLRSAPTEVGIDVALFHLLPEWLAPILVLGVIINTIALNAMTTYTSSMALQAVGIPLRRIPASVIVGAVGTAITVYLVLSSSLAEAAGLMLQFLVIVSAPSMAIFVVDVITRRLNYRPEELFDTTHTSAYWYTDGWGLPGLIALTTGGAATALCLATEVWVGPIAASLGAVDLSVPAGMLVAGITYLSLIHSPLNRESRA